MAKKNGAKNGTKNETGPATEPVVEPTTSLSPIGQAPLAIPDAEGLFDPADNMEGVIPRLPAVRILSQAQMFEMPDGSKEAAVQGVILDSNRCNVWWKETLDEGGAGRPPDCWSLDGLMPDEAVEKPQSETCTTCLLGGKKAWGTDPKGGPGKACKNRRRVHLLMDGHVLPMRLSMPPSSLRAYDDYATLLSDLSCPIPAVQTTITLEEAQNKDGNKYSVPVFVCEFRDGVPVPVGDRPVMEQLAKLRDTYRQAMRGQAIEVEEIGAEEMGAEE